MYVRRLCCLWKQYPMWLFVSWQQVVIVWQLQLTATVRHVCSRTRSRLYCTQIVFNVTQTFLEISLN